MCSLVLSPNIRKKGTHIIKGLLGSLVEPIILNYQAHNPKLNTLRNLYSRDPELPEPEREPSVGF